MWDMNDVIKITYKNDYIFHVEFDYGVAGDIDFHEYINKGPIFLPLQTKEFLKSSSRRWNDNVAKWSRYCSGDAV